MYEQTRMLEGGKLMKIFSLYDHKKPFEHVIERNEFSGIVVANVHFYKPGETHNVHSHTDHEEVFVCFQGRGRVITDDREIKIARGDVLVFRLLESHGFRSDEVDPLAYLCIGIRT